MASQIADAGDSAALTERERAQQRPLQPVKQCAGPCGEAKPLSAFATSMTAADGRGAICRACRQAASAGKASEHGVSEPAELRDLRKLIERMEAEQERAAAEVERLEAQQARRAKRIEALRAALEA